MSDHNGARLMLGALPPASHLIADRGHPSSCIRTELQARGIELGCELAIPIRAAAYEEVGSSITLPRNLIAGASR